MFTWSRGSSQVKLCSPMKSRKGHYSLIAFTRLYSPLLAITHLSFAHRDTDSEAWDHVKKIVDGHRDHIEKNDTQYLTIVSELKSMYISLAYEAIPMYPNLVSLFLQGGMRQFVNEKCPKRFFEVQFRKGPAKRPASSDEEEPAAKFQARSPRGSATATATRPTPQRSATATATRPTPPRGGATPTTQRGGRGSATPTTQRGGRGGATPTTQRGRRGGATPTGRGTHQGASRKK